MRRRPAALEAFRRRFGAGAKLSHLLGARTDVSVFLYIYIYICVPVCVRAFFSWGPLVPQDGSGFPLWFPLKHRKQKEFKRRTLLGKY